MAVKILGTGSKLPKKIVTNDDISKMVDTTPKWIEERTGICQRHISDKNETAGFLAANACKEALKNAKRDAGAVELIIVATCSGVPNIPSVSCQVQEHIGAACAVAFDINAACAGFLFAMNIAHSYMKTGIYKNALVVGAEVLSEIVDFSDRSTCILFGDGAGAVYMENDEEPLDEYGFIQCSDGNMGKVLKCEKYIEMDGREVFKFATRKVPECISKLLSQENIALDEVDYYVLHQANYRIIENIADRLGLSMNKFPSNLERTGNTSSATIPILLDELNKEGRLKRGMRLVLSGFGAGLTYGACILKW